MRRTLLLLLSAAVALLLASGALAATNVGYRDFSFAASGVGGAATPMMAQSELWFNDGLWWGVLFDRSSEEYHIYRYDWPSHSWNDTGTLLDERNFSKAATPFATVTNSTSSAPDLTAQTAPTAPAYPDALTTRPPEATPSMRASR